MAGELERGTGIKSTTVAKLLRDLEPMPFGEIYKWMLRNDFSSLQAKLKVVEQLRRPKQKLTSRSVVVVDESSLLSTEDFGRLIRHVEKASAKLILVGDHQQHSSVAAGGGFEYILSKRPAARLTENRRQIDPIDRAAIQAVREGRARDALKAHEEQGLLSVADTRHQAITDLFIRYKRSDAWKQPERSLVITETNRDAETLNAIIQSERRKDGLLGKSGLAMPTADGLVLHRGDRVRFTKNDKTLQVKNGDIGTVVSVNRFDSSICIRLDREPNCLWSIDPRTYCDLKLGYAVTTHRAQGLTVDHAFALLGSGMTSKESSYVAMSRARNKTHVFTTRSNYGHETADLERRMQQERRKVLAVSVADFNKPPLHHSQAY